MRPIAIESGAPVVSAPQFIPRDAIGHYGRRDVLTVPKGEHADTAP